MNFAARVLASVKVEALSYDQFRKWNYDKQVDYLNRHPESDFRLPEDEDQHAGGGKEDDGAQAGGAGEQPTGSKGEDKEDDDGPGPEPKADDAPPPPPSAPEDGTGGPGSIGTPRAGDAQGTPVGTAADSPASLLPELQERGSPVTNKATGEKAVRMDYDSSRDLIEDFLNKGWALKYDLATGSQLTKGDITITLTTESSGNSLVQVAKGPQE